MTKLNRFRNNEKLIKYGDPEWQKAYEQGLLDIHFEHIGHGKLKDQHGHEFINMISCSYLGLDTDKRILQGAQDGIAKSSTLLMGSSRLRLQPKILYEAESSLADLYGATAITNVSCGVMSCGVLPLIASGHMTDTGPVTMVFDKHAHFSMNVAKPICADEAEVLTAPHNDLNYLEDICKQHDRVAYVCDGIYSMGDKLPIKDLLTLQEKYGLFLYIDDSHGLSVYGEKGEGYARSMLEEVNSKTMIVGSLWKGLGARGSVLMLGAKDKLEIIKRHGGGSAWSQYLTTADCGAILASAEIHRTSELHELQRKLQKNIQLLDELIPNEQNGSDFPIRVLRFGEPDKAIERSYKLYQKGYYASAVFFPVVERGKAGIRIMMRANLTEEQIREFASLVKEMSYE